MSLYETPQKLSCVDNSLHNYQVTTRNNRQNYKLCVTLHNMLMYWDEELGFHPTPMLSATSLQYLYSQPGTAVAQLVEALRYKSEGRGFDSRWCHWNFSLT